MKIAAIRDIIRAATWTRSDLTGGTIDEFIRQDVGSRLTAKIAELRALVIAPRFTDDIEHRDGEMQRCEAVIARWQNRREEAKAAQIVRAENLGRDAYTAGKSSAPANDAVLTQAIVVICQANGVGVVKPSELLDAWIKGFHTANARAVQEAITVLQLASADVIDFGAVRARRMTARNIFREAHRLARLTKRGDGIEPNTSWGWAYPLRVFLVAISAGWCGKHGDPLRSGASYRLRMRRAGVSQTFLLFGTTCPRVRLPA